MWLNGRVREEEQEEEEERRKDSQRDSLVARLRVEVPPPNRCVVYTYVSTEEEFRFEGLLVVPTLEEGATTYLGPQWQETAGSDDESFFARNFTVQLTVQLEATITSSLLFEITERNGDQDVVSCDSTISVVRSVILDLISAQHQFGRRQQR